MIKWKRVLLQELCVNAAGARRYSAVYYIRTALGNFKLRLVETLDSCWQWEVTHLLQDVYIARGRIWRTPFSEAEATAMKDSLPHVLSDLEKLAGLGEE